MKWTQENGMMDGLTTNGVLIMHPLSGEHGVLPNCRGGVWREVSIAGDIYGLRRARSDRGAGKQVFGVFIYGAPKMPAALGRRGVYNSRNPPSSDCSIYLVSPDVTAWEAWTFDTDVLNISPNQELGCLTVRSQIWVGLRFKRRICSMLCTCNMHSKLIPTDHIYLHKYRNFLSVDTFLNPHMYLKSLLIVGATQ